MARTGRVNRPDPRVQRILSGSKTLGKVGGARGGGTTVQVGKDKFGGPRTVVRPIGTDKFGGPVKPDRFGGPRYGNSFGEGRTRGGPGGGGGGGGGGG